MRFGITLATALVCTAGLHGQQSGGTKTQPGGTAKQPAVEKHKHPYLHHALWALHHAYYELKESKQGYAGHKEKAEHAINGAIKHIEIILKHEKDAAGIPTTGSATKMSRTQLAELNKKYKHHPSLHHALHELKSAHHQLKESTDDFGGNRAKALHDMDHAIQQIELVLKHAKEADAKGKKSATSK